MGTSEEKKEKRKFPDETPSYGDRGRIQTCNRLIRSQLLYSVELRGHYFRIASAKVIRFETSAKKTSNFF
jgi:hypothetical protein